MTKKKKTTSKAKLTDNDRRNIWIITWLSIGLILGAIIGGIALTAIIGEQEFQTSIVGMKIGPTTEYQGAFDYDYIDLESSDSRTQDYSTWHPDYHLSNYATRDIDKYGWEIDPDSSVYGCPNVKADLQGEFYPSDDFGNHLDEFDYEIIPLVFYDDDGVTWNTTFYTTTIATQIVITVAGELDIDPWRYFGYDYIDAGAKAETPTSYNCRHGSIPDNSFLGNGVEFRIVLRNQIKEFKVGETEHSGSYDLFNNAFLWAKIGSVTTNIQSTAGWEYMGSYTGNLVSKQLVMYPSAKDALLKTSQLSDVKVKNIELGDTLYDTIYTGLDYEVKLGADWDTVGSYDQWALYNQQSNGLAIQGWQILVNVVFKISTGFLVADLVGHEQVISITNPFIDPNIIDDKFDLLGWLNDAWQTPWGRGLIIAGIVIVSVIIGFLFIKYVLPFLIRRAAGK